MTLNAEQRRRSLAGGKARLLAEWPGDPELWDWLADLLPLDRDAKGDSIFLCPRFDPVEKRCTEYERRPNVCRDYPFYRGQLPAPSHPQCGYWVESAVSVRGVELGVVA